MLSQVVIHAQDIFSYCSYDVLQTNLVSEVTSQYNFDVVFPPPEGSYL